MYAFAPARQAKERCAQAGKKINHRGSETLRYSTSHRLTASVVNSSCAFARHGNRVDPRADSRTISLLRLSRSGSHRLHPEFAHVNANLSASPTILCRTIGKKCRQRHDAKNRDPTAKCAALPAAIVPRCSSRQNRLKKPVGSNRRYGASFTTTASAVHNPRCHSR